MTASSVGIARGQQSAGIIRLIYYAVFYEGSVLPYMRGRYYLLPSLGAVVGP